MEKEEKTQEIIENNKNLIRIMTENKDISQLYEREAGKLRKYYRMAAKIKPADLKKGKSDIPRAYMCAPKNSFLEDALNIYKNTTSYPLDFVLMTTMHLIGGILLEKNSKLVIRDIKKHKTTYGRSVNPNLFSIFLGPSGCGKTRAIYDLADQVGRKDSLLEFGSTGAGTFEMIEENPAGTFYRDEFQEIIKQMNTNPHAQEQADIILKGYNGDNLQKITKTIKEQRAIEGMEEAGLIKSPRFSFVGSCTFEGFQDAANEVMFQNGFFQRFTYTLAERETDKKRNSYILGSPKNRQYDQEILTSWKNKVLNQTIKEKYFIDLKACEYLDAIEPFAFKHFNTDRGYSTRIREAIYKYAFIFHILRGKSDSETIEMEDVFFALRLGFIHCQDLATLFDKLDKSENEQKIAKVRTFMDSFKTKQLRNPKPYEIAQRIRNIKNTEEAKYLLNEIKNRDK